MAALYQTVQTFMGGALVNYFNRFGLQWQVYVQADGDYPHQCQITWASSTSATATGEMVPLSTLTTIVSAQRR